MAPRFGRWRVIALVVLAVWLLLTAGPLVAVAIVDPPYLIFGVPLLCLAVAGLPLPWRLRIPFGGVVNRLGLFFAFTALVIVLVNPNQRKSLLWILIGGLVAVRLVNSRWVKARELDHAINAYAAYEANLWGRPGEPLVDDGRTLLLPPSEVLRTRRTARLLEDVLTLPAAKLVHGARIGDLTVEHLLLAGSRVAVVGSIIGPPGAYSIDVYGSVLRNGQPFGGAPALTGAVSAWGVFLKRAEVRGFLVVLPASEGQPGITTSSAPDAAIACLSPQAVSPDLLAWLQPEGSVVDRRILYDVLFTAPVA